MPSSNQENELVEDAAELAPLIGRAQVLVARAEVDAEVFRGQAEAYGVICGAMFVGLSAGFAATLVHWLPRELLMFAGTALALAGLLFGLASMELSAEAKSLDRLKSQLDDSARDARRSLNLFLGDGW